MLGSQEVYQGISEQAERRKRDIIEAFGSNVLLSYGKANGSGSQITPMKSQNGKYIGKENKSPLKMTDKLYPSKPPRSVYNSSLIKSQNKPLGKSSSSPTEKETKWKWPPSLAAPYVSPFKTETSNVVSQSTINQSNIFKLGTSPRLYPSLPRLEKSDKSLERSMGEKDLKDHSNRSTANASKKAHASFKLLPENLTDPIKPLASSTVADLRVIPQESTSSEIANGLSTNWYPIPKDGLDQSKASSNDIEDTYDMDKFLEAALGSQLDLCSSHDSDVRQEEPFHTLSHYRSLKKRPSSSTLKSSMQHLDLVTPLDEAHANCVERLMKEADKQQQLMVQSSKALYICRSAKAFATSMSLIEGERLLLLSTLRHQAALSEIKNISSNFESLNMRGNLKLLNITADLKPNSLISSKNHSHLSQWFLCVLSFGEQVVASEVVCHEEGSKSVKFSASLELLNLPTTVKATFQMYTLRVRDNQESSRKSRVTRACKLLSRQSKSCLGPAASSEQLLFLRTPAFSLAGSAFLTLDNVHDSQPTRLTLDQVPLMSPLQGTVWLEIMASSNLSLETSGFLNILEQVGSCHTWQRRWCYFDGISLLFWNYPTDQDEKEPVAIINMRDCVSNAICVAPRHLCARARTLMLETSHLPKPQDLDSTLLTCTPAETIRRHFLSCDTTADMNEWTVSLNQAQNALHTWRTGPPTRIH